MQIKAESKRWVQKKRKLKKRIKNESKQMLKKKRKLISRLSKNYSLKVFKKIKNAQRSGPLEISVKIRGKSYNTKFLYMIYNPNNSRKQTMGAKKKQVNK